MKVLQLSSIIALAAYVAALAVAPAPRDVEGAVARALKERQTNRRDIARRANEHAGKVRRQAAPSVGLGGRCGGQPQGVEFFLYHTDADTGEESYGKYTQGGTNAEFGFLTVTNTPSEAVAFVFDRQCRLRGAAGPGQAFSLNSDTSIIMMGTDAYLENSPSTGYHSLTCRANNGELACSNALVPSNGLVCNYDNSYLWFTTPAGAESTGCVPVDLQIRRVL